MEKEVRALDPVHLAMHLRKASGLTISVGMSAMEKTTPFS